MALPYDSGVANYLSPTYHSRIKHDGTWRWVDQLSVKSGGSWRTVKQAYVKSGGTWRKFHDAENVFTFNVVLDGTRTSTFNLGTWLSNSGYVSPSLGRTYNNGDRIKGIIHVTGTQGGNPGVYIGNFGNESRVYIRINSNCRIAGYGGNGGNIDASGQSAGTALYTRTGVFIENNGNLWGGGGGAGVPVGAGRQGGSNGSYNSGGNGGSGNGCGSNAGGKGGNPGQDATGGNQGSNGNSGYYIDGASYVYSWVSTGDRRGRSGN